MASQAFPRARLEEEQYFFNSKLSIYILGLITIGTRKFSSPREEALELAIQTRKDILEGKGDIVSVLRSCLIISTNLDKKEDEKWLKSELSGYTKDIPSYRIISCQVQDNYRLPIKFEKFKVAHDIHKLSAFFESKYREIAIKKNDKEVYILDKIDIKRIFSKIVDKCLFF